VLPTLVALALAALTLLSTALVILMTALLALVGIVLRLALLVLVLAALLAVALVLVVLVVGVVGHDVLLVRGRLDVFDGVGFRYQLGGAASPQHLRQPFLPWKRRAPVTLNLALLLSGGFAAECFDLVRKLRLTGLALPRLAFG
jgi:hypothetical protein